MRQVDTTKGVRSSVRGIDRQENVALVDDPSSVHGIVSGTMCSRYEESVDIDGKQARERNGHKLEKALGCVKLDHLWPNILLRERVQTTSTTEGRRLDSSHTRSGHIFYIDREITGCYDTLRAVARNG